MATRSAARRAARHASLALQTPQGRTAEARLLRRLPAAAVLRVPAAPSAAARRAGGMAMRPFASSALPPHQVLEMPALSPTMDKGNLAEWNKKEGDRIREGEVLATIETDKSTMAWEVLEEGYIARLLVPDGEQEVEVGVPVAVMVEEEADLAALKDVPAGEFGGGGGGAAAAPEALAAPEPVQAPAAAAPAAVAPPAMAAAPAAAAAAADRVFASPAARKLAAESSVDVAALVGSGPGGRVVKADVEAAVASAAPPAAAAGGAPAMTPRAPSGTVEQSFTDVPHSMVRKVTAARLLESKTTVPHYYLTADVRMDSVMTMREELKAAGLKVSVNDFVIKASAMALMDVPGVNAQWTDSATRMFSSADISVAVQTEHGLMVPIVTGCEAKRLTEVSASVRELAGKARDNKLQPHEFTGGTFTISNLGMFGVKHFAAIINPPQAAILAVGATEARLVPGEDGDIETANLMNVTLSLDHRVVDGAMGAQWLQAFKGHLERPAAMLA